MSLLKTQGLNIWFFVKGKGMFKICPTSLSLGDVSHTEIDTTTLCETKMKQSIKGLMEKGELSIGLNFNPENVGHIELKELADDLSDPEIKLAIGCSLDSDVAGYNAEAEPTYDQVTDIVTLPDKRHWLKTAGSVNSFPFEVESDNIIKTTVAVKQSEPVEFIKAVA